MPVRQSYKIRVFIINLIGICLCKVVHLKRKPVRSSRSLHLLVPLRDGQTQHCLVNCAHKEVRQVCSLIDTLVHRLESDQTRDASQTVLQNTGFHHQPHWNLCLCIVHLKRKHVGSSRSLRLLVSLRDGQIQHYLVNPSQRGGTTDVFVNFQLGLKQQLQAPLFCLQFLLRVKISRRYNNVKTKTYTCLYSSAFYGTHNLQNIKKINLNLPIIFFSQCSWFVTLVHRLGSNQTRNASQTV